MPSAYEVGVRFQAPGWSGLSVVPIGTNAASTSGRVLGRGRDQVLWANVWNSTDVLGTAEATGLTEHLVLGSADAPDSFRWGIRLDDPKARLSLKNGGVAMSAGNRSTQLIRAPRALDANGRAIDIAYSLERRDRGYVLTLSYGSSTDANGERRMIAYPAVLDPDIVTPFETGEIECDTDGDSDPTGGITASADTSSVLLQFVGAIDDRDFHEDDAAYCVVPGPAPEDGSWVSFTGTMAGSVSGGNQTVSIVDENGDGPYENATSGFSATLTGFSFKPVGDVTFELYAVNDFMLTQAEPDPDPHDPQVRYLAAQNLVRTWRPAPVIGNGPNLAQSDVGFGFEVTHATGNVTTTRAEVAQPAYGGAPLELTRTYNSQDTAAGIMGKGWSTSYERRISIPDGPTGDMYYVAADGAAWTFPNLSSYNWDLADGYEARFQMNLDPGTMSAEPYELVYLDGHRERFDTTGRIAREVWPMGNYISYGELTPVSGGDEFTISDGQGHEIVGFVSSSNDRLTSVKDSLDREWTYGYDGSAMLETVTAPDTGVWTYAYDASDRIETATDPENRETSFGYDSSNYVTSVTDPGTAARSFSYDLVEGATTDTFGTHVTESVPDELGRIDLMTIDPAGEALEISQTYSERGQVTTAVDENGDDVVAEYDVNGCKTKDIDGEGNETAYADFAANCQPETVTDAEANVTTYTYDAYGNKLTMTTPSPDSQTTAWTYSTTPQPDTMDPPAGATISYDYDTTGQVEDESWVDGSSVTHHVTRSTYDDAGQKLTTRQGDLDPTEYAYDENGRLEITTDPLDNYEQTTYNEAGEVVASRDKRGNVTLYEYDERGNQDRVEDPLGNVTSTVHDQYGNATSTTDPKTHTTQMTYDKFDNMLTEEDPLNRVTEYTYDAVGNQLSEEDPAHNVVSYTYDANGNEETSSHPGPYSTSSTYTGLLDAKTETDERTETTTYGYDVVGRQTSITNPENEVSETGYDAAGRVAWNENGENERTTYTLDPVGRVIETENPDTVTSRLSEYDDAGREVLRTDEMSKDTVLTYDDMGRVLTELRADGGLWQYTYDANGNRLTVEDPDNEVTTYTYTVNNEVDTVEDPEGGITDYDYDDAGNLELMTDPLGKETSYDYDAANQRIKMTDPNLIETDYVYDSRGLLDTATTGTKVIDYDYDARGNMTQVTQGSSVSSYTYDGAGNVLVHTMPDGSTLTYTYDGVGRKTQAVHSVSGTTTWTYDAAGRVLTEVTSAGTTTWDYDVNGRVEDITYPGSMVVSFTYDDAGRLTGVTDWTGTRTYGRDDVGRVETFTTVRGKTGTNTWDTLGRKIGRTYYNYSGTLITQAWDYDAAGRVTTFTTGFGGNITYIYNDAGQVLTRTFPNSKVETFTYDDAGRLETQQLTGQPLMTYTYDSQDRITKVELTTGGTTTTEHRYAYNASGQLETWWYKSDWYRTDYAYDADGNLEDITRLMTAAPSGSNSAAQNTSVSKCFTPGRSGCTGSYATETDLLSSPLPPDGANPTTFTSVRAQVARYLLTHPMSVRAYTHNSDGQLTSLAELNDGTPETYTYDSRGNQVNTGDVSYDYANRLNARTFQSQSITYTHDGLPYSMSQVSSSYAATTMDYDDEGKILWARTTYGGTTLLTEYAFDPTGGLAAVRTLSAVLYPYYNHHGDVINYHAHSGGSVSAIRYSPWGDASTPPGGTGIDLPMYNGRDGVMPMTIANATNAYGDWRMGARTYSSEQGRFRQVDPMPAQRGVADTAYSYGANDPINRVDPDGRKSALLQAGAGRSLGLKPKLPGYASFPFTTAPRPFGGGCNGYSKRHSRSGRRPSYKVYAVCSAQDAQPLKCESDNGGFGCVAIHYVFAPSFQLKASVKKPLETPSIKYGTSVIMKSFRIMCSGPGPSGDDCGDIDESEIAANRSEIKIVRLRIACDKKSTVTLIPSGNVTITRSERSSATGTDTGGPPLVTEISGSAHAAPYKC